MLADYPIGPLLDFLQQLQAVELAQDDARLPLALAKEPGTYYAVPVAWAPTGTIVLHFPPIFPDTPPRIYLPRGAPRLPVVPHVNCVGQICCFQPSTVVNPTNPIAIVTAVLAKAEAVWTRAYTPEERLAEVEAELAAYWEQSGMRSLFALNDDVDHSQLLGVEPLTHPSKDELSKIVPLTAKAPRFELALAIDVPRDCLIDLLTEPLSTIRSLSGTTAAFELLQGYLSRSPVHKRTLGVWLLLRCATTRGPVLLAARFTRSLETDNRKAETFDERIDDWYKSMQALHHAKVEDLRLTRLQARTAGQLRSDSLIDVRLALAGCGSVGGFLADSLVRAGIRSWLFLDPDLLRPENLARHLLNFESLYLPKATELARVLRTRFHDLDVISERRSAQTELGRSSLARFGPTLVVCATGDTNADLTLSEACRRGEVGDCCFVWVEPNLAAGHLVYQPRGIPNGLHDLHEMVGGDAYYYKHRVVAQPRDLMQAEPGCQVAFTPYAGADSQHFAVSAAREITALLAQRPTTLVARRFVNGAWTIVA